MTSIDVPARVWRSAGLELAEPSAVRADAIRGGSGAASDEVSLITGRLPDGSSVRVVRKTFAPLRAGRHAAAAGDPGHWAYWGRELSAYRSELLPRGPGLRAPRCLAIDGDVLFLEYVGEEPADPARAAADLGRWHRRAATPDIAWLAQDQLAQRIAVSELDRDAVDIDGRLRDIWGRRYDDLARLAEIPRSIAHGDFGSGNLRSLGGDTVAIDWATLGVSPVGLDLAQLALASLDGSLLAGYLDELGGRWRRVDVELGYRTALRLIGTSRAHWMVARGIEPPPGHVDLVLSCRR